MGRSISAGASGGHVTVSGSVQTVNPVEYAPQPPTFRFRQKYNTNSFISRESGEFLASEMENESLRFWSISTDDTWKPAFYIGDAPQQMWDVNDTRLHTVFSLYSDFRDIYAETILSRETPSGISTHQYWHYSLNAKQHHNQTDTYSSRSGSTNQYPVVFPCGNNSKETSAEAMAELFDFPQDQGWKVYFKSRWLNKTTGAAGDFSQTMSISYDPMHFEMTAGIAGDLKFGLNYDDKLKAYNHNMVNISLRGSLPYDHNSKWMMNLDQTSAFSNISSTILKPNTRYLIGYGNRNDSSYKTYLYATTTSNQNVILTSGCYNFNQWPAGDYDIYIIGNGLTRLQKDGNNDNQYNGGPAGEIVKISKSFTSPFSAYARNSGYTSSTDHTILEIDGVEVGRALNGGGAEGGVYSNNTYASGPDAQYIIETAGQASDYARSNTWAISAPSNLHSGGKSSGGYRGLGFGAGEGGNYKTSNNISGFGGSGFGNYYVNTNINWAVVFVHKQ